MPIHMTLWSPIVSSVGPEMMVVFWEGQFGAQGAQVDVTGLLTQKALLFALTACPFMAGTLALKTYGM